LFLSLVWLRTVGCQEVGDKYGRSVKSWLVCGGGAVRGLRPYVGRLWRVSTW
jgi:hypothetical protein